jgi:hypothetical protein
VRDGPAEPLSRQVVPVRLDRHNGTSGLSKRPPRGAVGLSGCWVLCCPCGVPRRFLRLAEQAMDGPVTGASDL